MKYMPCVFVVSGSSAVGKSSIIKEWLKTNPRIKQAISYTTRKRRHDDVHGNDYYFVSKDEFVLLLEQGEFSEHKKIFNNYYGLSKSKINTILSAGFCAVITRDVAAAQDISKYFENVTTIFLKTEDKDLLYRRILERKHNSTEETDDRVKQVDIDELHIHQFDYVFSADSIPNCVDSLEQVFSEVTHDQSD